MAMLAIPTNPRASHRLGDSSSESSIPPSCLPSPWVLELGELYSALVPPIALDPDQGGGDVRDDAKEKGEEEEKKEKKEEEKEEVSSSVQRWAPRARPAKRCRSGAKMSEEATGDVGTEVATVAGWRCACKVCRDICGKQGGVPCSRGSKGGVCNACRQGWHPQGPH